MTQTGELCNARWICPWVLNATLRFIIPGSDVTVAVKVRMNMQQNSSCNESTSVEAGSGPAEEAMTEGPRPRIARNLDPLIDITASPGHR